VRYLAPALNLRKLTWQNEILSCSYYLSKSNFAEKIDDFKVYIKTEI